MVTKKLSNRHHHIELKRFHQVEYYYCCAKCVFCTCKFNEHEIFENFPFTEDCFVVVLLKSKTVCSVNLLQCSLLFVN